MRRISITGPESTGKSTLAAQLAAHFGAAFVPEYAREYLAAHGPAYALPDLEEIARGQLREEEMAAARGHGLLFCDTDLLVIKVWAEHAFGRCPAWIVEELRRPRYALTLLPDVDLPWQPDPLREHPHLRAHFMQLYRRELAALGWLVAEISGTDAQRLARAVAAVEGLTAQGRG
ncbi:AAA family ATPase [uncultured Hymenobacter sp.]|uniref:AAA family ATPase n=1 Tax=uncultured Hymenobacter sp. TaxID=170016 RepID=UPI0035CA321B